MESAAVTLITLGGLLCLGLVTDALGRRTPLPRVTLLLIFGFLIGPSALDLLPDVGERWFTTVANMALVMVGFLLGGKLTRRTLRRHGRLVLALSAGVVIGTALAVLAGLLASGLGIIAALLLAGIATATDPAATNDVVHETRARGRFSSTLLGIVAIDDAWGLILFSVMLAAAQLINGGGGVEVLLHGAWELAGAVLLGAAIGAPMAYLTGRIQPGEPTQAEALGLVLLCGGIAIWLEVSFLLAAMIMGMTVANLARHHTRPFHAVEGIEWPFMILFFVLTGSRLRIESLSDAGLILAAYMLLRAAGRVIGASAAAAAVRAPPNLGRWMGAALMPQAGVALGMALVSTQRFPELRELVIPVVVSATVLFEVVGPLLTRLALVRTGEARGPHQPAA